MATLLMSQFTLRRLSYKFDINRKSLEIDKSIIKLILRRSRCRQLGIKLIWATLPVASQTDVAVMNFKCIFANKTLHRSIFHSPSSVALIISSPSSILRNVDECGKRNGKSSIFVFGTFSAPQIYYHFCAFFLAFQPQECRRIVFFLDCVKLRRFPLFPPPLSPSLIIFRTNKSGVGTGKTSNEHPGNVSSSSRLSRNYSVRLEM